MRVIITGVMLTLALGLSHFANAQGFNVGYANMQYILSKMPESKTINSGIETYRTQLANRVQAKIAELQKKFQEYEAAVASGTVSDVERADMERELQQMQTNLEKFQQDAEVSMQQKQAELLQPAFKKIIDHVAIVAKEKGLNYVLQDNASGAQVILYASDQDDISNDVLRKMGIDPDAAAAGEGE